MTRKYLNAMCRCCGLKKINRPKGLCWTCYHSPARYEFGPLNENAAKYGVQGYGVGHFTPTEPAPTKAAPGTDEKIEVLRQRAERRQWLFHPKDATGEEQDDAGSERGVSRQHQADLSPHPEVQESAR